MCGRDDDPSMHDTIRVRKYTFENLFGDINLTFGQSYEVIYGPHIRFTGTFMGVKCGMHEPDTIHIYFNARKIGEIGVNIKDVENIIWVENEEE